MATICRNKSGKSLEHTNKIHYFLGHLLVILQPTTTTNNDNQCMFSVIQQTANLRECKEYVQTHMLAATARTEPCITAHLFGCMKTINSTVWMENEVNHKTQGNAGRHPILGRKYVT
jgi:hypothetical protein